MNTIIIKQKNEFKFLYNNKQVGLQKKLFLLHNKNRAACNEELEKW